jgi:hypothetical protein
VETEIPLRTTRRIPNIHQLCHFEAPHEVAAQVPTLEEVEVEVEAASELEEVRMIQLSILKNES